MEQIFKHFVSRRQAHFLSAVQQNCFINSNGIHTVSGSCAELPSSVKRLLGIKKALNC